METLARSLPIPRGAQLRELDAEPVAAWLLGFVLVAYLGLKGGGYDPVVRGEVGLAIWWILLLGAITGVLGNQRWGLAPWVASAALVSLTAWTGLGISWAESSEGGAGELARIATLTGVFLLALSAPGENRLRNVICGLLSAVALIAAVALLSRLRPDWLASDETAHFLPSTQPRLSYPLNYWNALGALMAVGLPLALGISWHAKTLPGKALAAATFPLMGMTLALTFSRGAAGAAVVGLLGYFIFAARRQRQLATLLIAGIGSTVLIAGATQRSAVEDGLSNQLAIDQGSELLAMVVLVCLGVGLLQTAVALVAGQGGWRHDLSMFRPASMAATAVALLLAVVIVGPAGATGWVADGWDDFKGNPTSLETGNDTRIGRFDSASGNGRYQYWKGAIDANASHPLRGIGPGGFESWWAQHGSLDAFVRDAHSLYFETFAELGIVGLMLLAAFLLTVLAAGASRCLKSPAEERGPAAAALAASFAFCVCAAVDWVWEVTVVPAAFLVLAGTLLSSPRLRELTLTRENFPQRSSRHLPRAAIGLVALLALVAIALPLAVTSAIRDSQAAAGAGRFAPALDRAAEAVQLHPAAASPRLQRALVLEASGSLDQAAQSARSATNHEPTSWRAWLVLSRIEAHRGKAISSVQSYRRAKALNPRSPLFAR